MKEQATVADCILPKHTELEKVKAESQRLKVSMQEIFQHDIPKLTEGLHKKQNGKLLKKMVFYL